MPPDLRVPLGPHVVQRVGVGDAEADQEHVGVRVGERPHGVVGDGACQEMKKVRMDASLREIFLKLGRETRDIVDKWCGHSRILKASSLGDRRINLHIRSEEKGCCCYLKGVLAC